VEISGGTGCQGRDSTSGNLDCGLGRGFQREFSLQFMYNPHRSATVRLRVRIGGPCERLILACLRTPVRKNVAAIFFVAPGVHGGGVAMRQVSLG
jgi:hypothetical protein